MYAAVSCSDKTIAIFDFETGDCEAAVYGHSGLFSILNEKQPPEVFYKEDVLKNFAIFTGKHLCWSPFLVNSRRLGDFKRDSNTDVLP